ncbi:TatD-related deoxyribonuclease [Methylocaldum marinum]|uniref:TatD-related deoxyribonuclease n=1 Tax=Methylocaldum marinum TaxID=1432792 RepID=A0A286T5J3_9GAMM|nr:TatD-related deoxyribonuclease [Methylocaldum marinum]
MAVLFKMQRERKVRRRMEAEMKMEGSSRRRGSLASLKRPLLAALQSVASAWESGRWPNKALSPTPESVALLHAAAAARAS